MKIKLVLFVAIIAGLVALFTVSFREKQFSIRQEAKMDNYNYEDENKPKPNSSSPIPTGVKSLLSLKAFPNPADSYADIVVNVEEMSDITLNVMDLTGKIVISKVGYLTRGEHVINLETSQIKTGIYVLTGTAKGTSGDVNVGKIKLVIRH